MHISYPDTFPLDSANDLIGFLKGTDADRRKSVQGGWALLGYGLGQVYPLAPAPVVGAAGTAVVASATPVAYTPEALTAELEKCVEAHKAATAPTGKGKAAAVGAFSFDWASLVQLLLAWALKNF